MPELPLPFPRFGVDVSGPFEEQDPLTTPIGQNVRLLDPLTLRLKGGSRPGLGRLLTQLPNGAHLIQHLNVVVDPTTDGLLDNFDWPDELPPGGIEDPSDGGRGRGRRIRRGGSGRQPHKNRKKTPRINWTVAATMPQGLVLSSVELNAQAVDPSTGGNIGGSYVYTPPVGSVLTTPGIATLRVNFTPTDTTTYRSGAKQVTTNVIAVSGGITSIVYFGIVTALDGMTLIESVNATRTTVADSISYDTGPAVIAGLAHLSGSSQVGLPTYVVLADSFGNAQPETNFAFWGTTGYWNSGT
jgi:hypothetical protein